MGGVAALYLESHVAARSPPGGSVRAEGRSLQSGPSEGLVSEAGSGIAEAMVAYGDWGRAAGLARTPEM